MTTTSLLLDRQPGRREYEYLERKRLQKLGLNESYSSFYLTPPTTMSNKARRSRNEDQGLANRPTTLLTYNTLSPFGTMGKPTCGPAYSVEADYRRVQIDVPPADLTRYRFTAAGQSEKSASSKPIKLES